MHPIPLSSVAAWTNHNVGGKWTPATLDTICPLCSRLLTLTLGVAIHDPHRDTVAFTARCPACAQPVHIWVVEPGNGNDASARTCSGIYMHPKPPLKREPVTPSGSLGSEPLERAYHSALKAYNVGLWDASITSCRKTLEGIVQSLDPSGTGPLFKRLQELFQKPDLLKPLAHLTNTLRQGGNLGAHFDLEREPDEQIARLMLDLLEYFLEYTFVLSEKSKSLEHKLGQLGNS